MNLLVILFLVTSWTWADSPTAIPTTIQHTLDQRTNEQWGNVCSDEQIFKRCEKYLIKQFGPKWAKYYNSDATRYIQKNRTPYSKHTYIALVRYDFSGPAGLQEINYVQTGPTGESVGFGPQFKIYEDLDSSNNCSQLEFWYGDNFVAPYNPRKLLSKEEASKIAKQKGYEVKFDKLELASWNEMVGRLYLWVPAYVADVDGQTLEINAKSGAVSLLMKPIPASEHFMKVIK
jgi:hypothetical protein